jgi:hypothetical protein
MSVQEVPYVYTPLRHDRGEIRLLKLLPLSSSSDIKIQVVNVPSSTRSAYEALSYVWGSPERTHRVTVKGLSGAYLSISQNLMVALHRLRLPDEPRTLWVDAICINQDDIQE